jgi:predicted secreted protein
MTSNAISAFGTKFLVGDGATPTEAFTAVAEVRNVGGPEVSLDTTDVTPHSTGAPWREFVATLLDAGEVSLDLNFLPSTTDQAALRADMIARTKRNFRIEWPITPTAQRASFAGFVTKLSPSAPHDGELSASMTIKITGAVTFGAAS